MEEHVHKHKHKHKRKHSDSVTTSHEIDVAAACDTDAPKSTKRTRVEDSVADESGGTFQNGDHVSRKHKHKHKKCRKGEDEVEVEATVAGVEENSHACSPSGSMEIARQKVRKRKRITEENEVTGKVNAASNHDPVSVAKVSDDSSSEHTAKRIKKSTTIEHSLQENGGQLDQSGGEKQVEESSQKKKKKKKKKKSGKAPPPQRSPGGSLGKESALQYLHSWEERREWSFKKKMQYWLLQHIYDKHQVCVSWYRAIM